MKRIRSKALYQYLLDSGVLEGRPEAIGMAKREFRKLYKRNWKRKNRPVKEIRYTVTLKQFADIRQFARAIGQKHTMFAKTAALKAADQPTVQNDQLLEVLQSVSLAINAFEAGKPYQYSIGLLMQAETRLKQYLKIA